MRTRDAAGAGDLSLLSVEWQGWSVDPIVRDAIARLADALFPGADFVRLVAPDEPDAEASDGEPAVARLAAIVALTGEALAALRERAPARLFHFGGTCGAELAPVSWLNDRYRGDLAVVWLDAHGDLNTPASSPSGHFHGMVLRTLLGEGPEALTSLLPRVLARAQVFLAGARELDPPEVEYVGRAAISVTTCDELGTGETLVSRIRAAGFRHVYAHLDLDVLDPTAFPHSLMQTPGGLAPDVAAGVIRALDAAFDVVGLSLVEYVPRGPDGPDRVRRLLRDTGIGIGVLSDLV